MKKALYIFATLACIACSKTEVAYEGEGGELALTPVSYNATKGAIVGNEFPTTDHIALFAYHNPQMPPTTTSGADLTDADYRVFAENVYLDGKEFFYKETSPTDKAGKTAWSGLDNIYYWPITGSLVFAGHSLPAPATEGTASPTIGTTTYNLVDDVLTIEGYTQSNDITKTFDLLYFGRDGESYNNRRDGLAVPVQFNHALAWITFNVKGGDGATVTGHEWKISNFVINGINTEGDFTYNGTPDVEWDLESTTADMTVYADASNPQTLSSIYQRIENKVSDKYVNGVVVIPQSPKTLTVTVKYLSPANDEITEEFEVDLTLGTDVIWEAGKRYVYNLEFSPVEIKVAPEVSVWPTTGEGYVETEIKK